MVAFSPRRLSTSGTGNAAAGRSSWEHCYYWRVGKAATARRLNAAITARCCWETENYRHWQHCCGWEIGRCHYSRSLSTAVIGALLSSKVDSIQEARANQVIILSSIFKPKCCRSAPLYLEYPVTPSACQAVDCWKAIGFNQASHIPVHLLTEDSKDSLFDQMFVANKMSILSIVVKMDLDSLDWVKFCSMPLFAVYESKKLQ